MKTLIFLLNLAIIMTATAKSIYDHDLKSIDGESTTLAEHKGKVILMVNVASRCGFTRQYKGLEELYDKYKDEGLVVCGFPCNQFGGQEPGSESEIKEFCSTKYGNPIDRFGSMTSPTSRKLIKAIEEALQG